MDIRVEVGDLVQAPAKAVIVNLFEGVERPGGAAGAMDKALGGAISQLIADGEIRGKLNELTLIHTFGKVSSPRVLVVGLGKQAEFDLNRIRDVSAVALRHLRKIGADSVASIVHGAGIAGLGPEACGQAIAEGAIMGLYRYDRLKKPAEDERKLESLTLVESDASKTEALRRGIERGSVLAQAANQARDMANEPANFFTPTAFAERASALAQEAGLECQIMDREDLERMGMGALLGVAAGSVQPPKLIVLNYRGDPSSERATALLGKGVTFDSGGISIKPANGMEEMKGDMCGGAAVVSALWALGKLRPPINVTAIVPTTENMPSGSATKPGDVVRAMNGKTIEVINTDAEGRLILADAICYAKSLGLEPIIDVATLTGAMAVALGEAATGFLTSDGDLAGRLMRAGEGAGERMWQLPLIDEYRE
ncbi:MAG: leucyl aminopeptidase, partial [Dehalococcoidia bacterium]